jgi:hypothetical protein
VGLDCTLLVPLYRGAAAIEAGSLDWLDGFAGPVVLALAREDAETHRAVGVWGRRVQVGSLETVEQQRPGLYAALNDGLARVKTEYVQQCGVDDEAYWRTHDRIAKLLGARKPEWIAGRCETRNTDGRRTGAGVYRQLLHGLAPVLLPLTNVIGTPAVIFSAAAAREAGGWDETMPAAADYDLWLKLHARQRPFMVPFATGRFLVRPETSLTRAHRKTSLEDCYRSRRRYFRQAWLPGLARGVQSAQFKLQDLLGE